VVALNKGYKKEGNESFQKNFQKTLMKKEVVLCTRFERHADTVSRTTKKQEEHVPRHIELTAVLEILTKNRE
jgi:hypothetical protein